MNKEPVRDEENHSGGSRWALFLGLPLIVAVAVAAVLFSGGQSSEPGGQEGPSDTAERAASSNEGEASGSGSGLGTPVLGSADAPVVMLEYGDFQ
jgi:hypothetical protein